MWIILVLVETSTNSRFVYGSPCARPLCRAFCIGPGGCLSFGGRLAGTVRGGRMVGQGLRCMGFGRCPVGLSGRDVDWRIDGLVFG